jgi:short-subunit dehydrogenase
MNATVSRLAEKYGPWAVITGASDGIGRAFAHHLAREGLHLVLVARRDQLLNALADELHRAHGVQCRVYAADLSDLVAVDRLAEFTADLDVGLLVAAAGFGTSGPLLASQPAVETEMVDLNCSSVLVLSWHLGQKMVARGRGGVVFMSSLLAFHGTPGAANYAATKAYIQTLAEGLRVEWAPLGVDVIASAPGPIRSGFAQRANMSMNQALPAAVVARVTLQALGRKATVRPGWLSKLLGWSLAMLPRWAQIMVISKVMKGMTAHRESHSPPPIA